MKTIKIADFETSNKKNLILRWSTGLFQSGDDNILNRSYEEYSDYFQNKSLFCNYNFPKHKSDYD